MASISIEHDLEVLLDGTPALLGVAWSPVAPFELVLSSSVERWTVSRDDVVRAMVEPVLTPAMRATPGPVVTLDLPTSTGVAVLELVRDELATCLADSLGCVPLGTELDSIDIHELLAR